MSVTSDVIVIFFGGCIFSPILICTLMHRRVVLVLATAALLLLATSPSAAASWSPAWASSPLSTFFADTTAANQISGSAGVIAVSDVAVDLRRGLTFTKRDDEDQSTNAACSISANSWINSQTSGSTTVTVVVSFFVDNDWMEATTARTAGCTQNTGTTLGYYSYSTSNNRFTITSTSCSVSNAGCLACGSPTTVGGSATFSSDCSRMYLQYDGRSAGTFSAGSPLPTLSPTQPPATSAPTFPVGNTKCSLLGTAWTIAMSYTLPRPSNFPIPGDVDLTVDSVETYVFFPDKSVQVTSVITTGEDGVCDSNSLVASGYLTAYTEQTDETIDFTLLLDECTATYPQTGCASCDSSLIGATDATVVFADDCSTATFVFDGIPAFTASSMDYTFSGYTTTQIAIAFTILAIVVLAIAGGVGYFFYRKSAAKANYSVMN